MAFDQPKYWISLAIGVIIVILGGIPLLNQLGINKWSLPAFLVFPLTILLWLVAGAGFYVLIDSFISEQHALRWFTAGLALVIMTIAIIQILSSVKILAWQVPFISLTVLRILFVVEGLGLIVAGLFGDF